MEIQCTLSANAQEKQKKEKYLQKIEERAFQSNRNLIEISGNGFKGGEGI